MSRLLSVKLNFSVNFAAFVICVLREWPNFDGKPITLQLYDDSAICYNLMIFSENVKLFTIEWHSTSVTT